MQITGLIDCFSACNVVGRVAERHLTHQALHHRGLKHLHNYQQRPKPRYGGQAFLADTFLIAGAALGLIRMGLPAIQAAKNLVPPLWGGMFVALEGVFGRGVRGHPDAVPAHAPRAMVLAAIDVLCEYGLLGAALECLPYKAALGANHLGCKKLAACCMGAAIAGRVLLQVPRAGVALWGTCVVLVVGAVGASLLSARALFGPNRGPAATRALCVAITGAEYGLDILGDTQDPGGPGLHGRVRTAMATALKRFSGITEPDADGGQAVRAAADGIARDLEHFCARAPNDEALRYGLATLSAYVAFDHPEAMWRHRASEAAFATSDAVAPAGRKSFVGAPGAVAQVKPSC